MEIPILRKFPVWLIIIIALLVVFLTAKILSWQYDHLEKKEFSILEEKIEELSALGVLKDFLEARIQGNGDQAITYLTEDAMEQKNKDQFNLTDDFKNYLILETKKLEKDKYQFSVKIYKKIDYILEKIIVTKVLEKYYIDSVIVTE